MPCAMTRPPSGPPPGPSSTNQSQATSRCGWCSTDNDRVAALDQFVQHAGQARDIVQVLPDRRFIQNEQRLD